MREEVERVLSKGAVFFAVMFILFYANLVSVIAAEGTTDTRWDNLFTEESPDPICWHDPSGTAFWAWYAGGFSPSIDDCHRDVVAEGSSNDCCDASYTCDTDTNRCISSEVVDCGDYKNSAECFADAASVAVSSVDAKTGNLGYCQGASIGEEWSESNGVFCGNYTNSCRCAWKDNECTADYNITKICTDGNRNVIGTCSFSISDLTNCSAGFRTMKWIGNWAPGTKPLGASCDEGERRIPCPVQLDFISTVSIILAVVLIIILYLVMSRRKKDNIKLKSKKKYGKRL